MFEKYVGETYTEEMSQEIWDAGYDEGHRDGMSDAQERYQEGYEIGEEHGYEAGHTAGYEEGYADGERLLYSVDNPLEVITEMEHEINMALTSPVSNSYEETLIMIQRMCQSMLKDWGQYVNTGSR